MNDNKLAQWRVCCRHVYTACNNEYAQSYARAGYGMTNDREIKAQALYILSNLGGWREKKGEDTGIKATKENLNKFAK